MSIITQNPYTNIVVVCDSAWKNQATRREGSDFATFRWYPNVYEALASMMLNGHSNGSTLMCIRVDALTTEEMGIFRCLAGMPDVTAVAFCAISQPVKLAQARQLGAKDTMTSEQLMEWLRPVLAGVENDISEGKSVLSAEESATQQHSEETARSNMDLSYRDTELTKIAEKVVAGDFSRLAQQQIGQFSGTRQVSTESEPPDKPVDQGQSTLSAPPAEDPKRSSQRKSSMTEPIQRPTLSPDELEALLG
jgi:hypothetical protein